MTGTAEQYARAGERVLVLTPSLARAGGIQRYTLTLIRALKDLYGEQRVRSVALPDGGNSGNQRRVSTAEKLHFGWRALSEVARWKPDLIICTHLALGPIAWLLAGSRRQYWIVAHGIEAWCVLPPRKRGALRRADRVIVTSAFSREQVVRQHSIGSERMMSLPCALDENLLNVEPSKNGPCQLIPDDRQVVLTVSRMAVSERYKGHEVVLRALTSAILQIPELLYVIVGGGDDKPRLEQLAKELDLSKYVLFTGEVSDSELAALYRRSDVFVLPARTVIDNQNPKGEGFGIVFLEAMAFGKPVIGPNYGAPAELIRDGENGFTVDPEDPASMADAIVKLLTDRELASRMGRAGRDWTLSHYSYHHFRDRVLEVITSSLSLTVSSGYLFSRSS